MFSIATTTPTAQYDTHCDAVVIDSLSITDPVVATESHRWSTGRRGPMLAPSDMRQADLSTFVTQAISIGGPRHRRRRGLQEQVRLEALVAQVGDRTTEASSKAATVTAEAITAAATAMERASTEAKKSISDAGVAARQSFSENVEHARAALVGEIGRLLGGENPELLGGRGSPGRTGPVARPGRGRAGRCFRRSGDSGLTRRRKRP